MIIATAGHIDHGKTLLVKCLTNKNTDSLPEEKLRGMSIDLGFAYKDLGNNISLGFIDVPGHERFIQNMLAGVIGVDFGLLVIAADDGPMPQTNEHLEILNLLGISRGAVAITKIDKVKSTRIDEVINLSKDILRKTSLEKAPFFPISNLQETGINNLKNYLKEEASKNKMPIIKGEFRLAIDRKFNLKGIGLIVTGTIFSGVVRKGDIVILSPKGIEARVRGIHSQNKVSEIGFTGQRCALNLVGTDIEKSTINRGDWILSSELHVPSDCIDAVISVSLSEKKPLRNWTRAYLHLGSSKIICRVVTLENKEIIPGCTGFVQLKLEQKTTSSFDDCFILRDQSAMRTIGGGRIIDPLSIPKGRSKPERIEDLHIMNKYELKDALAFLLSKKTWGMDLKKFTIKRNLNKIEAQNLFKTNEIKIFKEKDKLWGFSVLNWSICINIVYDYIDIFFKQNYNLAILNEEKIIQKFESVSPRYVIRHILNELISSKKLLRNGKELFLTEHKIIFSSEELNMWKKIKHALDENKYHPPTINEVAKELNFETKDTEQIFKKALKLNYLVQVSLNRYFYRDIILYYANIVEKISAANTNHKLELSIFRNEVRISRNLTIELLEFFDRKGFTIRLKNERYLHKKANQVFQ
jgi:selenocysteine-specific elongation factor